MPFKTRRLGGSDLEVPIVCLGTMTWGEQNTEEEAFEQLDYALKRGVTFIDTAELYPIPPAKETNSRTELYIGRWLASRQCREKVIIATKVSGPTPDLDRSFISANRQDPPKEVGEAPQLTAAQIKEACAGSLRRLQTSYIDLYQIHWPARYTPLWGARQYRPELERTGVPSVEEQVQAMGDLIKEGKIKYWGLSNETATGVILFTQAAKSLGVPPPISIQNDFSLLFRCFEEELAEACAPSQCNLSLLAYGPLAGGTLSNKYNGSSAVDVSRSRHTIFPSFQERYHTQKAKDASAEYAAIAKRKGITPSQLALAWTASRWYMGSVIIGATTMEQLKENIDAFEIELDEATLKEVDEVHIRLRNPNARD